MKRGPLSRVIGTLGLLALVPTAVMSATGTLTPTDTALRAGVTLMVVMTVRKVAVWYITAAASSFEKRVEDVESEAAPASAPAPGTAAGQAAAAAASARRRREDRGEVDADQPTVTVAE